MGTTFEAIGVVGYRFNEDELYVEREKRGCGHSIPYYGSQKFCPTCGRPAWVGKNVMIAPLAAVGDHGEWNIAGYSHYTAGDAGDGDVFFGESVRVGGCESKDPQDYAQLDVVQLLAVELAIRKVLEPLGLWKQERFGVWIIRYVSS